MQLNEKLTEVLNDLIKINNDRTVGYERASEDARDIDTDLRTVFDRLGEESKHNAAELTAEVVKLGGTPATGTTASGKIYRAWMDVKATFTGKDRYALLSSCEFGEDATQQAYVNALSSDADMTEDIRLLIRLQQTSLKTSHDLIKRLRDIQEVVK
jgi:uncharacterized protein (TIGR02284 family)